MDHPIPGLKYLDSKDLDEHGRKFSGMGVKDADGERLGEVEGFVMDVREGRPRHIAVVAGWFTHKHFLLPIGHATLSADGTELIADVRKERVKRFPGFDRNEFDKLGAAELDRLDATMAAACGSDFGSADSDAHYRVPGWWQAPSGIAR
jgi:hypothetical protein